MVFRMLRGIAAAAVALFTMVGSASAVTTYYYQGTNYTEFGIPGNVVATNQFTSELSVTGSLQFSEPLPANAEIEVAHLFFSSLSYTATLYPTFLEASFSSGVDAFRTYATGSAMFPLFGNFAQIRVATDALGNIASWAVWLSGSEGTAGPFHGVETIYSPGTADDNGTYTNRSGGEFFGRSILSGSWSMVTTPPVAAVPIPAGGLLLASALTSLALLRLRGLRQGRRHPHPSLFGVQSSG